MDLDHVMKVVADVERQRAAVRVCVRYGYTAVACTRMHRVGEKNGSTNVWY